MSTLHRARWAFILIEAALAAAVIVAAWLVGQLLLGNTDFTATTIVLLVVWGGVFAYRVMRLRKYTLTLTAEGPILHRDGAVVTLYWAEMEQVHARRWGLWTRESLVFKPGLLVAADPYRGFGPGVEAKLRKAGVDRSFEPAMFFADWRTGPLGAVAVRGQS
ncbi:hypothetical protein [Alloactinosynnema sp. L-07]|uniref:hypothetical protein n=1 Tax=Alloactinosynnema sp. L-07 TaxID=1653480 RepID=UPI0012FC2007|nr:hypothetical protein [Alloactinosynnema sp. L-07]